MDQVITMSSAPKIDNLSRSISLNEVADDRIILSVSPCRSGSTAVLRALGALGVESYLQPLKNLLRWRFMGVEHNWQPHGNVLKGIYIKETLGPFNEAEAQFNPLSLLVNAGVNTNNLLLLVIGRTPLETWASWRYWWPDRTNIDLFIKSYLQTEKIRQEAVELGIESTTLVYEAFRDHSPDIVMKKLCRKLEIDYDTVAVEGWQHQPRFGEKGSGVSIPHMPEEYKTKKIRQRVEEGEGLSYFSRAEEAAQLGEEEIAQIDQAGLWHVYDQWRYACEAQLGLAIMPL